MRVSTITCQTPLDEALDSDPFLADARTQQRLCEEWAARHGHTVHVQHTTHDSTGTSWGWWKDADDGLVDIFLAPNRRVLERALRDVGAFEAECKRRGIRVETTGLPEPAYTAEMKARVHRRLSMPTAGYHGC
ncbi:hypothetical protein ACFYYR_01220 [Streptomyces sp. NPDC001922]|uniref:hypothetical protein n=1 Tax=Streptomyces sp. NPDC001922 TaxID=3364624 RepID=UPI0036B9792E